MALECPARRIGARPSRHWETAPSEAPASLTNAAAAGWRQALGPAGHLRNWFFFLACQRLMSWNKEGVSADEVIASALGKQVINV